MPNADDKLAEVVGISLGAAEAKGSKNVARAQAPLRSAAWPTPTRT
jgi:hypothetical protein